MSRFFPALAGTDCIGVFLQGKTRSTQSILRHIPEKMATSFLTSLSFDESIHYEVGTPEVVFVDCGAFHYVGETVPRFKRGGFVSAFTAMQEYQERHLHRKGAAKRYLLCSPDHIIAPDASDSVAFERTEWTLSVAQDFIEACQSLPSNVTGVAVVHGRTMEERASMTRAYIEMGFRYIAFGGLVPIARKEEVVLQQIAGLSPDSLIGPSSESPLGIAAAAGCSTHMFGLNSPDWYRWWRRLDVTSFDGSKLSQEGARNGIIWYLEEFDVDNPPATANGLYSKTKIKQYQGQRKWNMGDSGLFELTIEDSSELDTDAAGWEFSMTRECTNPTCGACKEGPHTADPRTTGSIDHNMGRTIVNAHVFDEVMRRIDQLIERAENSDPSDSRFNPWRKLV